MTISRFEHRLNMRELSDRRKMLIYTSAAEAVMDVRLILKKLQGLSPALQEELDKILSKAQHNAGTFAIRAARADLRHHCSWQQLIEKHEFQHPQYYLDE